MRERASERAAGVQRAALCHQLLFFVGVWFMYVTHAHHLASIPTTCRPSRHFIHRSFVCLCHSQTGGAVALPQRRAEARAGQLFEPHAEPHPDNGGWLAALEHDDSADRLRPARRAARVDGRRGPQQRLHVRELRLRFVLQELPDVDERRARHRRLAHGHRAVGALRRSAWRRVVDGGLPTVRNHGRHLSFFVFVLRRRRRRRRRCCCCRCFVLVAVVAVAVAIAVVVAVAVAVGRSGDLRVCVCAVGTLPNKQRTGELLATALCCLPTESPIDSTYIRALTRREHCVKTVDVWMHGWMDGWIEPVSPSPQ